MTFEDLKLSNQLVEVLNNLGLSEPTEIQKLAIPYILQGKDIVGRSETGSGKTFAFALPIVQNIKKTGSVDCLVVCPTRELAMQVAEQFSKLTENLSEVSVCAVYGGSNLDRQKKSLKKLPNIVVGTPGRIIDLINQKALKLANLSTLVLDEADEMLDMGFRDDIEEIISKTNSKRQTLLFSATIPDEIKEITQKYQKNSVYVEVGAENKALDKINQQYIFVLQKNKMLAIKELFLTDVFGKTIVFVNTKRYAEELESFLNKNKIYCKALHGDMRQSERKRVLQMFKDEKIEILIATDVAARGLDIKEVKFVVNFDLPQQLEFYVHRIGRTARAGKTGEVINIISNLSQMSYMREIEKQTKAKINLYSTENQVLKSLFVDTKKLAQKSSRFGQSKRQQYYESFENKKTDRTKNKFSKSKHLKNSVANNNTLQNKFDENKNKSQNSKSFKKNKNFAKNNFADKISSKKIKQSKTKKANKTKKQNKTQSKKWYDKFKR